MIIPIYASIVSLAGISQESDPLDIEGKYRYECTLSLTNWLILIWMPYPLHAKAST